MIDNNLRLGKYNWLGLWTLCQREIKRFSKVGVQTVLAPVAAALIFLAIFAVALGRRRGDIAGVPFVEFLAPGLIMMAMIQNGLLLARVPAYWYQGVIGLLMVLAVIINTNAQKRALGMSVEIQG
ncbi:MAG: multidrug ABC transporter permease, partial [Rhodospirillales bacterium]|nr:multidrug ABC transporter permease [Rhodospirillales bacterium]